jgi:hypothetical protein
VRGDERPSALSGCQQDTTGVSGDASAVCSTEADLSGGPERNSRGLICAGGALATAVRSRSPGQWPKAPLDPAPCPSGWRLTLGPGHLLWPGVPAAVPQNGIAVLHLAVGYALLIRAANAQPSAQPGGCGDARRHRSRRHLDVLTSRRQRRRMQRSCRAAMGGDSPPRLCDVPRGSPDPPGRFTLKGRCG